jgi:hypothetical protein
LQSHPAPVIDLHGNAIRFSSNAEENLRFESLFLKEYRLGSSHETLRCIADLDDCRRGLQAQGSATRSHRAAFCRGAHSQHLGFPIRRKRR